MNAEPEDLHRTLSALLRIASDIPEKDLPAALAGIRIFERILAAREALSLKPGAAPHEGPRAVIPPADDVLLSPDQTAALLGVKKEWLYRNAQKLPFAVKISRKQIRFWKIGALKWAAAHRPRA